jgi:pyridoxamine 5'-phosphate oxidase
MPNAPLPEPLPENPLPLLDAWLREAITTLGARNPTAMTVATADAEGRPSARTVLCRGYDPERGSLVFYTDLRSQKAQELSLRPRAACVLYWYELDRQVRVEGPIRPLARAEVDACFASRPGGAQLAAEASAQSRPLASRADLVERHEAMGRRFGVPTDASAPASVPTPERWGGYRVWIERLELGSARPAGCTIERALSVRSRPTATDSGAVRSSPRASILEPRSFAGPSLQRMKKKEPRAEQPGRQE